MTVLVDDVLLCPSKATAQLIVIVEPDMLSNLILFNTDAKAVVKERLRFREP